MRNFNIVKDQSENLLSVQHFKHGFHGEILERTEQLLDHAVARSCKVYAVRLDFTYPEGYTMPPSNRIFSNCLNSLTQYLSRKKWLLGYIWRYELGEKSLGHWHLVLLLDGNRVQNSWGILNKATQLWGSALETEANGLVHLCQPNSPRSHFHSGFQLCKHQPEYQDVRTDVLGWLSYMAKCSEYPNSVLRQWGSSTINSTGVQND